MRLALAGGPRRPGPVLNRPYATLKGWSFTLACEHFRRFNGTTYISPSEGHLWNAWVEVYNRKNNLIYSSFETGLYDTYVRHLLNSKKCREEIGVDEERLKEILKKIEEEWKEVTRDC